MSKIVQSPGEFLSMLLEKHGISILKLSKDIGMSQSAVRLIAGGKTRISVQVALRLARYFNTNPEYWLNMQMRWDLLEAAQDKKQMDIVKKISKFEKDPAAAKKAPAKKPAAGKAAAGKPAPAKGGAAKAAKEAAPGSRKKASPAKGKTAEPKEKPAGRRGRSPAQ